MLSLSPPNPAVGLGRPSTYSEHTVSLLCGYIRQRGLSDSAAARRVGIPTSTLSRWKHEHEDLLLQLACAREDFRETQLTTIQTAAAAEGGGWRAAAWLLERIFPEDYSPRATERQAFRLQETEAATREESAATAHHHCDFMAELHVTHPEDFSEEGLYAPAELLDEEEPSASLQSEESQELPTALPSALAPAPIPSTPAPPAAPSTSPLSVPTPSVPVFHNSRNPLLTPDLPCLGHPSAVSSRHRDFWQRP